LLKLLQKVTSTDKQMPPIVIFFIGVFIAAFCLFGIIVLLLSPSLFKGIRKHSRLFVARRSREFRGGADVHQMDSDARGLEGTYYFE